jgi:hypothetical protein
VTLLVEQLLEGEADRLFRKAIERALEGDVTALRLCLERIVPPRRERCIDLPLPASKTASEVSAALAVILAAVGEGRITPGEGETLARMVEIQRRVIEVEEIERRVQELENAVAEGRRVPVTPEGEECE